MGEQLVVVGVDGSTASYTALRFCRTPGAPARPCMQCAAVRRCWRKAGKRRSLPSRAITLPVIPTPPAVTGRCSRRSISDLRIPCKKPVSSC
jgi:hypothetical protein